jgi:hypothetical protein
MELPQQKKIIFEALEALKIAGDLGKNRPITEPLAKLMRIDPNIFKKSTVDQLLLRSDADKIKAQFSNHEGLMDLLKKEAPGVEEHITAKMDYELKHKNSFRNRRFLKGSLQCLSGFGIGALMIHDLRNLAVGNVLKKINPIEAAKISLCFLGLGYAAFSLASRGIYRINKAITHEKYWNNQKNIAQENRVAIDKVNNFNYRRSNPGTALMHADSSSSDDSSNYPANK